MSIAVLVFFIAEIFSRFSSAKLGAANAATSAEAKMLLTNAVDFANVISDWFLLTEQYN
jgi:hypothetical protein